MATAVQWWLGAYLVLKVLQYFFVARPGFGRAEPGLREKLLRGEPLVFLVAGAMSVPIVLWSSWYFHRGYERGLERSADCYGRLSALRSLGAVESGLDALRVMRSVRLARHSVSLAAEPLELTPGDATKLMADKSAFYARRYSILSRQGGREDLRAEASAIERCMSEPLINF